MEIRERFWQPMNSGNRDVDFQGVNPNSNDQERRMTDGRSAV